MQEAEEVWRTEEQRKIDAAVCHCVTFTRDSVKEVNILFKCLSPGKFIRNQQPYVNAQNTTGDRMKRLENLRRLANLFFAGS